MYCAPSVTQLLQALSRFENALPAKRATSHTELHLHYSQLFHRNIFLRMQLCWATRLMRHQHLGTTLRLPNVWGINFVQNYTSKGQELHQNIFGDQEVRYFRKPLRGPPTHGAPKPPSNKKRKFQKTRKPRLSPKIKVCSPKVNACSQKVNVLSPKVNVKYFKGIFEEFNVFEMSCWGVTVTGVSKISSQEGNIIW